MSSSKIVYLARDDLIELQTRLISRYGGMPGIRDEAALDSCLSQPRTDVFGVERFPTLALKAAAYCFFIIRNHPFFDGNKRTGLTAATHFLIVNGTEPLFDQEDTYATILQVAAGEAGLEELAALMTESLGL